DVLFRESGEILGAHGRSEVDERLLRGGETKPRLAHGGRRFGAGRAAFGEQNPRFRDLRLRFLRVRLRPEPLLRRGLDALHRLGLKRHEPLAGLEEFALTLDELRLLLDARERLEELRLRATDLR